MRDFFATCPKGLEYLLVDELKAVGASDVHEALSGVYFRGEPEAGYRACLWSRLASRILMPISEFAVENGDQLYEGAKAIDWTDHLPADIAERLGATIARNGAVLPDGPGDKALGRVEGELAARHAPHPRCWP